MHVRDADELADLGWGDGVGARPGAHGKWSDLALPTDVRRLFRNVSNDRMVPLDTYGAPELGIVSGANDYFALSESRRRELKIPERHLRRISPPGTKHLTETVFSAADWTQAKKRNERVWLFSPGDGSRPSAVTAYIKAGEADGVHEGYKCRVRTPWWQPPTGTTPDLFFTYMSHRYPRLITNDAGVHRPEAPEEARDALPLLAMNSATMLGGEVMGRSYGGGILKMEPREAALLPMPGPKELREAWSRLADDQAELEAELVRGEWRSVVATVDRVLLREVMGLNTEEVAALNEWATIYRVRRTRQTEDDVPSETRSRRAGGSRSTTRERGSHQQSVAVRRV